MSDNRFEHVDKLPDAPWTIHGAYMSADTRKVEVSTISELLINLNRMLELSPSSEVIISKNG